MSEPGTLDRLEAVRWHPWTAESFARAASEQKPILLALTTSWSEECAAMDRTSYASSEVRARINARFIAIRVDADRRPDVSERYSLGGWPTTAFLTPDGAMLGGGTYLDPERMPSVLDQVTDAWWQRRDEIVARRQASLANRLTPARPGDPDANAASHLRSLMLEKFDGEHGGFDNTPKFPHAPSLMLALSLNAEEADPSLDEIIRLSLDGVATLWDPVEGGFFRYAKAVDWTRPGTEKLLEDNGALLRLHLDAAVQLEDAECRNRAAALVRWVKASLLDETDGGFFNGQAADTRYYGLQSLEQRRKGPAPAVDRTLYVDRNAEMASGFLRAAELFSDPWLLEVAIKSLERVVLGGYSPGQGVVHVIDEEGSVRGLLGDQLKAASALLWAHAATGRLPYTMLAAELAQYAIRQMWDEERGAFADREIEQEQTSQGLLRERVWPFTLNCEAACLLERLTQVTGDTSYHDRALAILRAFAREYQRHGLFGTPYALAIREVLHGRGPVGLNLSRVDWKLGESD